MKLRKSDKEFNFIIIFYAKKELIPTTKQMEVDIVGESVEWFERQNELRFRKLE